jgi:membrane protein implicated in regulation of membrane protease activity
MGSRFALPGGAAFWYGPRWLFLRSVVIEVYWALLIIGIAAALVSLLVGDLIADALDGLFDSIHPLPALGGMTIFGTAGIILSEHAGITEPTAALLAAAIAASLGTLLHFVYVRPMRNAESSLGYTLKELQGRVGEVTVAIRGAGYGEVLVRVGGAPTYQLAGSFDGADIPEGTRIVVVETREGAVYVAPFDPDDDRLTSGEKASLPSPASDT